MLLSFPPHSYNYGVANKLDCLPIYWFAHVLWELRARYLYSLGEPTE